MSKLAILGGKPIGKINIPRWPFFTQEDVNAVAKAVSSGIWGFRGPYEKEFESAFASFCKTAFSIAVTNGTHSLRLALEALNIGPGDEVLVPGLTWQATAAAVLDVNAIPVLVDIDPETYTIDINKAEQAITSRTKCIIPVHLYGRMADMDGIMKLASKYKLFVIEDCAHQHGAEWNGKRAGSIGDVGSFSLQSTKILNCGEGGVLTTNNSYMKDLLQSLKNCGRRESEGAPTMQSGNYRMTEFQAALLLVQLSRLDEQNAIRDDNAKYLEKRISQIPGIKPMYRNPAINIQAYYNWTFRYYAEEWDNIPRERFFAALSAELEGAVTPGTTYEPLNDSPLYRPFSKKTHKLDEEYFKAINPQRFELPECKKAYSKEAVNFFHTLLLMKREDCAKFADAIEKIWDNRDELKG
ncbi:MAG: DegT/DnrJ/EryC1/StrS family aminotransferase [Firmicutes bacterium]|nr:DegT/DnrJ/EryC1/StrS family aminotransferase [Bacillota bacterium]